jgi:hypothetical protein
MGQPVMVQSELPVNAIQMINSEGITVREWNFDPTTEIQLNISDLPAGNYWLLLVGKEGHAVTKLQKG